MNFILQRADGLLKLFCGTLFALAVLINFGNVVGRYIFSAPIYWAEEVTILLIVFAVFLMSFRLALYDENLKTDILMNYLSERWQRILETGLLLFAGLFTAYLAYHSSGIVAMMMRFGQVTPVAEIPMFIVYGSVLMGFILASLASFIKLYCLLNGDTSLHADKNEIH